MKNLGYRVELVTEFAKDITYDKAQPILKDQLYVTAEQFHRVFRLSGQVDFVITDSPIPIGLAYAQEPFTGPWFTNAVLGAYDTFDNIEVFVRRAGPYRTYGRNETEEQARALDAKLEAIALEAANGDPLVYVDGNAEAPLAIYEKLVEEGFVDILED